MGLPEGFGRAKRRAHFPFSRDRPGRTQKSHATSDTRRPPAPTRRAYGQRGSEFWTLMMLLGVASGPSEAHPWDVLPPSASPQRKSH
jgi:hypothetical protein